jgi:Protein of unknown function (DUF1579)
MEMPKPHEALKKLQRMIGEWSGGETMHPAPWDPKGGPATARIVNRSILDGHAVVQEYQQRRNDAPNFAGHGVFWYDRAKNQLVMTWWDSMGGSGSEFRGDFTGDVLELQRPMPQGGQSRASFDLSKPGQYSFLMTISGDGQNWQPAMEGQYRKRAAKSTKAKVVQSKGAKKAQPKRSAKPAARVARAGRKAAKRGRKVSKRR